jgi:TRAP-type C4-dicarboxylate transport system substrate-binding protein
MSLAVLGGAFAQWPVGRLSDSVDRRWVLMALCLGAALTGVTCVNTAVWDALSDEDKEIVKTAARESSDLQLELWIKGDEASRKKVVDGGVKFNEVADKAAFQKAMEPVYTKAIEVNPALEALIAKIKAVD